MAAGIIEPDGKRLGTSTIGAGFGGAVGFGVGDAIADIVVHSFPNTGPVEDSIAYLLNFAIVVLGIILGGKFTPSNQVRTIWGSSPSDIMSPPVVPQEEPLEVSLVDEEEPEEGEEIPVETDEQPEDTDAQADDIRAELAQIQTGKHRSGSTTAGEVN